MPVARLRVSSSPSVCHVLVDHSGTFRLAPWCRRPAVTARVAGAGSGSSIGGSEASWPVPPAARPVGSTPAGSRNVRAHGHHRCKRNRHGWGLGHRGGGRPAARRARAPRSSSPTCRRTRATALADEIGGAFCKVDVTKTDDIINAVEMAKSMGPVRVLVNSAGIGWAQRTVGKDGSYDSAANLDAFKKVIAINLIGTFDCIRLAATAMSTDRAAGVRRARRDRQHRVGRRVRRPDRPGRRTRRRRAASSA